MTQLIAADFLIRRFNTIFIEGSFITVLLIILVWLIFKGKAQTQNSVAIVKWLLIAYASLSIIALIINFPNVYFSSVEYLQYTLKVNDPGLYIAFYWFLCLANTILPFALFVKKLGRNVYILFGITLLMNLGWLFESVVFHFIDTRRDYAPASSPYFIMPYELGAIKTGLAWGVVAIVMGYVMSKVKERLVRNDAL